MPHLEDQEITEIEQEQGPGGAPSFSQDTLRLAVTFGAQAVQYAGE